MSEVLPYIPHELAFITGDIQYLQLREHVTLEDFITHIQPHITPSKFTYENTVLMITQVENVCRLFPNSPISRRESVWGIETEDESIKTYFELIRQSFLA